MAYRQRIFRRNFIPSAPFAPIYNIEEVDGVRVKRLVRESDPQFYSDCTNEIRMNSGLPLNQFRPSPDGSSFTRMQEGEADSQFIADELRQSGYDLSKPLSSQKQSNSSASSSQEPRKTSDISNVEPKNDE